MGDLSNKLIRQTFDGIIKTNDEDPITSVPKRLQDGKGNNLPVEVALGGMTYYGAQDFTNATVTGISGGGGATYDLTSVQNGDAIDIKLTGSDLSIDTVQIQPGTNITLTETATNVFTIDAAGGGGGAVGSFAYFGTGTGLNTGNDGPYTFFTDIKLFYPFYAVAGYTLKQLEYVIRTAYTGGAFEVAIYNTQINQTLNQATYGIVAPKDRQFSPVSCPNSATGFITVSGLNYTFPYTGVYFLGVRTPGIWDGANQTATNTLYQSTANSANQANTFVNFNQTAVPYKVWRYSSAGELLPSYTLENWDTPSSSNQCWIFKCN